MELVAAAGVVVGLIVGILALIDRVRRNRRKDPAEPPTARVEVTVAPTPVRPAAPTPGAPTSQADWDVFICHASEDKAVFVRPLAERLRQEGIRVWYDELTLTVGDSLRRKIDEGLARSRYGVVVLSRAFFGKKWPQDELDGLVAKEGYGEKVILPVWWDVVHEDVAGYSLTLAGRLAAKANDGMDKVAADLMRAMGMGSDGSRDSSGQSAVAADSWLGGFEIVVVDDWHDERPAAGAKVTVSGQGSKLADANGKTAWGLEFNEDTFNLRVEYQSSQGPAKTEWGSSGNLLVLGHRYIFWTGRSALEDGGEIPDDPTKTGAAKVSSIIPPVSPDTGRRVRGAMEQRAPEHEASLPNRDSLVRAISAFMSASQELIERERELYALTTAAPHSVHVDASLARESAHEAYVAARRELDSERLVAGARFGAPISDFITLVVGELADGERLRPRDLAFHGYVQAGAAKAVSEIDEIIAGGRPK